MPRTFERNALYEEVWGQPMTSLAAKYNLSDNGLRKICMSMNIPMPSAGHWAKIAAGKAPPRTALPQSSERTSYTCEPVVARPRFSILEDESWLQEMFAFERQPENRVDVEQTQRRWHPVAALLRDGLREAAKDAESWRRDFERGEKNPKLRQLPGYNGGRWRYFVDRGQVLIDTHHSRPLRLTLPHFERGLGILNAICVHAEKRRFEVSLNEEEGRVILQGHGGAVPLRMTEKLIEGHRQEINSWSRKPEDVRFHTPSGLLRVYVGSTYSEKEIADRPDVRLEDQLNALFEGIYGRVIRAREDQREREDYRRRTEEAEKRRKVEEEERRKDEARREAERKRRDALIADARNWATAKLVRDYVEHVMDGQVPSLDAGRLQVWADWARSVANDLDPTHEPKAQK